MSALQSLSTQHALLGVCGAIIVYHYVKRKLPLPPGPRPLPLIGNLLDMPTGATPEGRHWARHRALYGPISSVTTLGTTLVIINDSDIAFDLMERRSSIYSSRPPLPFAELVGLGILTTLRTYGDTLRLHRKWMQSFMGPSSDTIKHIKSVQEIESRRLLLRLLENPGNFLDHLRTFPGAVIFKLAFGYTIEPEGPDYLVDLSDEANDIFSKAAQPGRWLIDIIPSRVKYVPEWFPGAGFKKIAREWNSIILEFCNKPFEFVKRQKGMGTSSPSFIEYILEKGIHDINEENNLKYAAATLYGAGSETTVVTMTTFILAMVLHPSILARAQEEIDRIIGDERLPNFADRENLPYIDAIIKETLRWETVVPTGIPHATTEEDIYMGYRIPKGAIIVPNVWNMAHDQEKYNRPFHFNPERFLGENRNPIEMDPRTLVFGFGRRICPGKELAENSMFIAATMLIAMFDISKAKDEFGKVIEPVHEYLPGVVSHPKPFRCSITPRSEKATALIRSVLEEHPFQNGDGKILKEL